MPYKSVPIWSPSSRLCVGQLSTDFCLNHLQVEAFFPTALWLLLTQLHPAMFLLQVDAFFPTGLWFGLDNSTVVEVRGAG